MADRAARAFRRILDPESFRDHRRTAGRELGARLGVEILLHPQIILVVTFAPAVTAGGRARCRTDQVTAEIFRGACPGKERE